MDTEHENRMKYISGMEETTLVKRASDKSPSGRRSICRPRIRWSDNVPQRHHSTNKQAQTLLNKEEEERTISNLAQT